ncbi:hypothetical protein HOY82DRAFT_493351 [Tuber indicum]|nr:hypothetical protein HOY82DRAFT_493351 [Tuber indicum]
MSPGKGDSGEFFDTRSDAPGNNPDSVEVPGDMGSEGGITLSKPPDTPHSCQVGSLRGTEISTPRQPTAAKIDGGFGRGGIAGEKEGSTNPQSHVEARGSDVGSQKGTQRVDETESQKVEIGPAGFCTATASPPTPQYDQRAPECPTCRQAAAPSGTPKSLEEEGNLQSKPKSRLVTALSSYVSSLWGKPASQKPPTAPSQASIPEVHEATDTVLTPQEPARAIKSSNPRRSRSLDERKVSWDDIVKGKKLERSESPSSFAGSSPDQQSLPPVTAGGNSIASGGPYAGDPLGIGIQLGDNVYSLMSTEVHCEHSASGGRVIKAEANSLTRASPASEYYYEESPFADIRDEAVQIAAASYCGQVSDEVEDRESLAASRPKAWVVNRPIVPSPMRSPFRANFFPWSDAQGIPLFGPSSVRKEAPTPAIGPLGERSNTGSPMIGRTPRVGAESPCLSGHASCVHTSNTARPSPTLTTAESPNPTAFGNTRLHRGSPAGRTHPVSGRLVPPHGPPGASVRGMQSGRYQSVIQEEREEFSHSFMDESGLIRYYRPFRNCGILGANNNTLCLNQPRTVLAARSSYQEVCCRAFQSAPHEFEDGELPRNLNNYNLPNFCSLSLLPLSIDRHSHRTAVQNIICRHLVNNIFSAVVPSFCFNMEAIAGELLKLDPSKQALWQRLTVEALEALPQHETAAAKLRQKTVNKILASIGAISASPAATLAESLQELVKSAQEAWEPTFKSKAQTIPEVDVENGTANFKMDPEDSRVRGYSVLQVENITRPVLCTFPAIHQIADGHGTLVVPGRALFSDFYHSAEMELQAKLKTWKSDQRYAHRASFMRPPFVHRNTRSPTSPESQSGRWGTGRMSHEYFGYNQWCSHLNDVEDETVDLWDVSMRLKEYDQEVLRHERRRSTGSETFSERRSSYIGRSRSFSNGRRESVYSRRESVYERRVPVGGRRESFYGGRRESFQGSRDYCRW